MCTLQWKKAFYRDKVKKYLFHTCKIYIRYKWIVTGENKEWSCVEQHSKSFGKPGQNIVLDLVNEFLSTEFNKERFRATLTLLCIMLEWLPRFLSICVHSAWDFKPRQCDTTCSLVVRTIAFGIGINITHIYLVIRSGACSSGSGRRLVGQGETQCKSHVLCNPWIITSCLRWNEWAM